MTNQVQADGSNYGRNLYRPSCNSQIGEIVAWIGLLDPALMMLMDFCMMVTIKLQIGHGKTIPVGCMVDRYTTAIMQLPDLTLIHILQLRMHMHKPMFSTYYK